MLCACVSSHIIVISSLASSLSCLSSGGHAIVFFQLPVLLSV